MNEISTWGMIADIAWGITFWAILTYFWLTAETLIILTVFLWLDIIFWVLDSYLVTKDTSSTKLVQWLAKKLTRRALPFVVIAAFKWIWHHDVELISNMIMTTLIISEWYSIIWHFYSINYWEKIPEIDAIKILFNNIEKIFKNILKPDGKKKDK